MTHRSHSSNDLDNIIQDAVVNPLIPPTIQIHHNRNNSSSYSNTSRNSSSTSSRSSIDLLLASIFPSSIQNAPVADEETRSVTSNSLASDHISLPPGIQPINLDDVSVDSMSLSIDRTQHQDDLTVLSSHSSTHNMQQSVTRTYHTDNKDVPFRHLFFHTNTSPPPDSRTYHTYPDDDNWSASTITISSLPTRSTQASTISASSKPKSPDPPYHNPMFLGCLDYYYPRRLRPLPPSDLIPDIAPIGHSNVIDDRISTPTISSIPNNNPSYASTAPIQIQHTDNTSSDTTSQTTRLLLESDMSDTTTTNNSSHRFVAPRPITIVETLSRQELEAVLPGSQAVTVEEVAHNDQQVHWDTSPLFQTNLDQYWGNFQESSSEVRPNDFWGDLIDTKCSNTCRIYFQNVNSLGLSQGNTKINTVLQSMQQADCDIINMVQTSINWRFLHLRNRLRIALKKVYPIHKINVSRNKFSSAQPALPGGCAQIVQGDWSGRIVEYIHDFRQMGRWCGIKLRLKGDRHLH